MINETILVGKSIDVSNNLNVNGWIYSNDTIIMWMWLSILTIIMIYFIFKLKKAGNL